MLIAQLRVHPVLPLKLHKHVKFGGWAFLLQLLFLGKEGFWVFVQIVTVLSSQTVLKWWGENPEKAPNSARQLRSLGHWWSLVRCLVTRPRNCSTQFFIFYETRIVFCQYLVCFATFLSLWWRECHHKQKPFWQSFCFKELGILSWRIIILLLTQDP